MTRLRIVVAKPGLDGHDRGGALDGLVEDVVRGRAELRGVTSI